MLSPATTLPRLEISCAPIYRVFAVCAWPTALVGQFLFVFAIVALSSPGRIDIVDGQTRYEVSRSLVDHGDSVIRDKSTWFAAYKGRNGDKYTDYRLPQSVLGVGAILLADATGTVDEARRQFFFSMISPFMAAILAVIYTVWFRHLGFSAGASLAWGMAGILCTPSWYYGTSSFDDILGTTAVVFAVAVVWINRERRPILGAALAGLALAWAVNCKPPLVFFALPVLAIVWFTSTQRKQVSDEAELRGQRVPKQSLGTRYLSVALIFCGVVLGCLVYKAYDAYKFPAGSDDLEVEFYKMNGAKWTPNPVPGLVSLAFSPACGVLWFCPTLFLSWRGWRAWRDRQRLFCIAVLAAALLFTLFISFLTFFKGDPAWGPRYLTPVFALFWVFVPAGFAQVRVGFAKAILLLGVVVQLLGLSVDPQRLFVRLPLHWNYYNAYPWLGFDGSISHLVQRPREIVEVLTPRDMPAAEFSPAPLPTHAGGLGSGASALTSIAGLGASPLVSNSLGVAVSLRPIVSLHLPIFMQNAVNRYHVFRSPRPWILNQWYLADDARPVDLPATLALLTIAAMGGLALMFAACRIDLARTPRDDACPNSAACPQEVCSTSGRDLRLC